MNASPLVVTWLATAACLIAQAPTAAELSQRAAAGVTVRVDAGRARRFVGEAALVRFEVRYDRALFASHAAPLFQRELDAQLQVVAPWLDSGDAAVASDVAAPAGKRTRIVVNERIVEAEPLADQEVAGRSFAGLAFARRIAPRRAGALELSPPRVRFALASAFRDDFVNGRVPVDRIDCEVVGAASTWAVEEPPTTGRPASFCGAVGRLLVTARAASTDVGQDGRVEVALVVRGDCDLASWSLPKLAIPGFHVLGALDRGGKDERAFALELEVLDGGVAEVPPIELASFDPESATFVVAASAPIPLRFVAPLRPRTGATPAKPDSTPATGPRVEDFDAPPSRALPPDASRLEDAVVVAALALPWLLFACAFALRSRAKASRAPRDPRAAAAEFEAAVARGDADLLAPFERWLGARTASDRLPDADGDVELALARAGFDGDLALRAVALRRSLLASRYKGMTAAARVAAQRFVEEAERALDAGPARGAL